MNVFATIVVPEEHRDDALVLAAGTMNMLPQFTTNPSATPPPTHRMNSGYIPEEVRNAFAADGRFVVSDQPWEDVATSLGLVKVVYEDI
jgi:hypothetical protein